MGAGKSTVMERYIHSTDLYKLFGDNFVVIAADEFKEDDPIYTSLSKYSDNASQEVHAFSQSVSFPFFLSLLFHFFFIHFFLFFFF